MPMGQISGDAMIAVGFALWSLCLGQWLRSGFWGMFLHPAQSVAYALLLLAISVVLAKVRRRAFSAAGSRGAGVGAVSVSSASSSLLADVMVGLLFVD